MQNLLIGTLISIIHAELSPVLELLLASSGDDLVRLKELLGDLRTAGMLLQELELHC